MSKSLKMFITYAHKNSKAKDKLITYLAVLKQNGLIDVWHDNEILPGDKWRDEIFNNLADSDILLYLTCPYSLASENCNKELTAALNPNIRVIPIILEHCDWQNHQLSEFQALPDKGKPINEWQPESKGWQNVVDGIRKVIKGTQSQADPASITIEKHLRAELAFQQGNFLMMLGQIDGVIKAYSTATQLYPSNSSTYHNRGVAYAFKGDLNLAIEDFDEAIRLNPQDAGAYSNLGLAYNTKGDYDRAIAEFDTAIKLNPKDAIAHYNRGIAYTNKTEYDRAIQDFNKAIRLKPKYSDVYSNRGFAYIKKGEISKAIEDFNTVINLEPNLANAYSNRGAAYERKGDYDRAIEDFNTAIQQNPRDAIAYYDRLFRSTLTQQYNRYPSRVML